MNLSNGLFVNYSIVGIVIVMLCLLFYFLYYQHMHKIKLLQQKKVDLLHTFSGLLDHTVIIFSDEGKVVYASNMIQEFIETKQTEDFNDPSSLLFLVIDGEKKSLADLIAPYKNKVLHNTLHIPRATLIKERSEYPVSLRISRPKEDKSGAYIGIAIFDQKEDFESSRIHYQNTTTGLPNHNKAMADIGLMAHRHASTHKHFAVAVISVDNFLEIISVVGYKESLQVIMLIARYLQAASVENDLKLYHVTSNNFLLILPDTSTVEACNTLVEKYKTDCEALLHSNNAKLHYTISSGISIYPDNSIENLVNSAYGALLRAKKQGLGYTMVADADQKNTEKDSLVKYSEIKKALKQEEFSLYYQPIYDAKEGKVTAAEALIRWIHPSKGIIPPEIFLPLVEKTGFMRNLGEFVAKAAVEQLAVWKKLGFRDVQISINLSLREFETMDYPMILDTLLCKNNVNTSQLKVEVTENIAMANKAYSTMQFTKLKKLGIDISLDDFGTGYSSFSMLETFPIDTLKIDKSFIKHMSRNKDRRAIVAAIITMSHALGIKVIAEGIEDKKTVAILKDLGCDYMQGYYLGKPMPIFEFQELIRSDSQISDTDDTIVLAFNH